MSPVTTLLRDTPFDPDFLPGARNAIECCLRIQPNEKVTLITDRACLEIGAALAAELERLGLNYHAFVLEDLEPRPLENMPGEVLAEDERRDEPDAVRRVVRNDGVARARSVARGPRRARQRRQHARTPRAAGVVRHRPADARRAASGKPAHLERRNRVRVPGGDRGLDLGLVLTGSAAGSLLVPRLPHVALPTILNVRPLPPGPPERLPCRDLYHARPQLLSMCAKEGWGVGPTIGA